MGAKCNLWGIIAGEQIRGNGSVVLLEGNNLMFSVGMGMDLESIVLDYYALIVAGFE